MLFDKLSPQLSNPRKLLPKRKIFLLDSTTIDLCLNVFDWAKFRKRKGAIKLHTVLDFDTCMPTFVDMSDGKKHDIKAAHDMEFESGSIIVADRGYLDFKWLCQLNEKGIFFVVRCKENVKLKLSERTLDRNDAKNKNIQVDWEGYLENENSLLKYSKKIRMVQVWDEEQQMYLEILTNNFTWTASTISELYKRRWTIEQFFKEIKSHLKIKTFIGTSMNAVLIQIWTALITIMLLKTLKKEAKHKWHLSNLIAFIRLNLFVKIDLKKWLDKPFLDDEEIQNRSMQTVLF
jgi:transposase